MDWAPRYGRGALGAGHWAQPAWALWNGRMAVWAPIFLMLSIV